MNICFPNPFRIEKSYDRLLVESRARADTIMSWMCTFLFSVCLAVYPINNTLDALLVIGLPTVLMSWWFSRFYSGRLITRVFMSCAFMAFTGLLIHQLNGDIEAHFAAFGLIGVLLFYRDWRCVASATTFIYLHHLILGYAQSKGLGVFVFDDNQFWSLFGQHVAYFLPFIGMMGYLSIWLRIDASEKAEVIELTQSIADNQFSDIELGSSKSSPLVRSVVDMKHHLQDLIRLLPVPIAVIRLEDDKLISSNEEWKNKFGTHREERFEDQGLWQSATDWSTLNAALLESISGRLRHVETHLNDIKGKTRCCELSLFRSRQSDGDYVIVLVQDITDHREKEARIGKLAYRDLLTDLPNRAALTEELNRALSQCLLGSESIGVAMLDLDAFKPVNDTYGHDAGDLALRELSNRLSKSIAEPHIVGRIGGDEFVMVFRGIDSAESITPILERCIDELRQPVQLNDDVSVTLGCSIGVVYLPAFTELSVRQTMKLADTALYEAKLAGKNGWKLSAGYQNTNQHASGTMPTDAQPAHKIA